MTQQKHKLCQVRLYRAVDIYPNGYWLRRNFESSSLRIKGPRLEAGNQVKDKLYDGFYCFCVEFEEIE